MFLNRSGGRCVKTLKIILMVGNVLGNEKTINKKKLPKNAESPDFISGDPTGIRTRVTGVRGRRPNH